MLKKKTFVVCRTLSAPSLTAGRLISLLATVILYVVAGDNGLMGQTVSRLDTDSTVGLSSDIARIEFDKATGKLVGIVLREDHIPLLDAAADKGNPFRIYFGVKRIADKPIGGDYIDAGEFVLKEYRFSKKDNTPTLKLICIANKGGASFEAVLDVVAIESGAFDLTLSVKNTSDAKETIMVEFPYVSGVTLSDDPASDLSIYMTYSGHSGVTAWQDLSNRYNHEWTFQFDIVYNKQNSKSFGYMILDKKFSSKRFERESSGGMKVLHVPGDELESGQVHTYPTARVMGLTGSWKGVAREYGDWFRENFKMPIQPRWYRETNSFQGMYAPDWTGHTGYKPFTASAEDRQNYFDTFTRDVYLNSGVTVQELCGWFNWSPDTDDPYAVRPDLGSDDKLKNAIAQTHGIGRHLNSYFGASTGLMDLVEANKPRSYFEAMREDGSLCGAYPFEEFHPRFGFRQATMCPGLDSWRKLVVQHVRRVLGYGFDGVRLDEQPHVVDCFNPEHHHENPYNGCYRVSELMRMVREDVDKIGDPNIIIMSEWGTDFQLPYINSVMVHSVANFRVSPARVAFPELYWLPHSPLGVFECALNGWVVGSDGVCTLVECLDRAPEMPWLRQYRERFTNLDHGPATKWRLLRSQFLDALVDGSTSDIDPYCVEDEFWRGTLFKADDYYLLVGGYANGSNLRSALKIRIDYLPEDITEAYEIDAYNLEKGPAKIVRDGSDVFVTVKSGFSVVLLPMPTCRPKIEAEVSEGRISLSMFAPWRKDRDKKEFKASIEIPGFEMTGPSEVTLPAIVEYKKTAAVEEAGHYYFIIRGDDTLPYRGWFESK